MANFPNGIDSTPAPPPATSGLTETDSGKANGLQQTVCKTAVLLDSVLGLVTAGGCADRGGDITTSDD